MGLGVTDPYKNYIYINEYTIYIDNYKLTIEEGNEIVLLLSLLGAAAHGVGSVLGPLVVS